MRDFLDSILSEIDSESLTDNEFDSIDPLPTVEAYDTTIYNVLKTVLQSREGVSGQLKRLQSFFIAKGVDLTAPAREASSQIFFGSPI
jgi:hypothetical protein